MNYIFGQPRKNMPNVNIHDRTLPEALQSPLFMAYKEGQPFNGNHLRPCPLLDNPEALRRAVEISGARSTDLKDPEDVRELTAKCEDAARSWGVVADKLWESAGHCADCENEEKRAV